MMNQAILNIVQAIRCLHKACTEYDVSEYLLTESLMRLVSTKKGVSLPEVLESDDVWNVYDQLVEFSGTDDEVMGFLEKII